MLIAKKAAQLPPDRPLTRDRLRQILRLPSMTSDPGVRHLVTTERKGYAIEKIEFLSEPGVYIPAWVFVPSKADPAKPVTLWVHESGKEAEGMEFGRLEGRARAGELVVAVDVRGTGETRPPHSTRGSRPGDFAHLFDVETAMAYMAWYVDESLLGMRVFDVIRSVDYALSRGRKALHVHGRGAGALWALFAAALDERIQSVTAERMLLSYRTLAVTDRYTHNASSFAKDILLEADLPQVAALAAPRKVTLVEPVDAMKRPVPRAEARSVYRGHTNVSVI
jgi:cephalosporin-C deacetylase-like acetyl esterase